MIAPRVIAMKYFVGAYAAWHETPHGLAQRRHNSIDHHRWSGIGNFAQHEVAFGGIDFDQLVEACGDVGKVLMAPVSAPECSLGHQCRAYQAAWRILLLQPN